MAAAGQLQQQGFGSVAGGVTGHHMAGAAGARGSVQGAVAPGAGGGLSGLRLLPHLDLHWQPLLLRPLAQLAGLLAGMNPQPVVAVPKLQLPVMQPLQVLEQSHQRHRILSA